MKQAEREALANELRAIVAPGDTVYTVLKSVSRSGMFRRIEVYKLVGGDRIWLTGRVASLCGYRYSKEDWRRGVGLGVSGCGMDMGFSVVYDLSHVLYGAGYKCRGKRCQSNFHRNTPKGKEALHRDGYALKHAWL